MLNIQLPVKSIWSAILVNWWYFNESPQVMSESRPFLIGDLPADYWLSEHDGSHRWSMEFATLPEHPSSSRLYVGSCCTICIVMLISICLFVLFQLTNVFSILLWFTSSNYRFGINKLLLSSLLYKCSNLFVSLYTLEQHRCCNG